MNREHIFAVLKSNLEKVVEGSRGKEITETHSLLKDYGADSLEVVEVVSRTMKELKVKIPRTALSEAKNIGQLVDLFVRAAAPTAA
jgi:acyl carrier protein